MVTEESFHGAAKAAAAMNFYRRIADSYNTNVGEQARCYLVSNVSGSPLQGPC